MLCRPPRSIVLLSSNYYQKNICRFIIYVSYNHFPFLFPFLSNTISIFVSYFIYRYIKQSITRRAATTTATATRQTEQQFAIVAYFDKCNEYAVAVVPADAPVFAVHSP